MKPTQRGHLDQTQTATCNCQARNYLEFELQSDMPSYGTLASAPSGLIRLKGIQPPHKAKVLKDYTIENRDTLLGTQNEEVYSKSQPK